LGNDVIQAGKLNDDERGDLFKQIIDEAMEVIRQQEQGTTTTTTTTAGQEEDKYVRARSNVEKKAKELISSHHERDLYDSHHEDHHEGHHEDHHDVDLDVLFSNDEINEEDRYHDQKVNQEDKHVIIKTDGTKLDEKVSQY